MGELSTTSEEGDRARVVILGGGFGGLNAAQGLRKANVEVVLIDRQNHHVFQPLLYQVATAGLNPADIAVALRNVLSKQKNARVVLGEVVGIDRASRQVRFAQGSVSYDYLVIAAGMKNHYFGKEEAWRPHATGLKNLEEAVEIRRRMLLAFEAAEYETDEVKRRKLLTFVVVGGGPTGVEMAGALAEVAREVMVRDFRTIDSRLARIVLVEGQDRLLPTFSEVSSAAAKRDLEARGVEVVLNTRVGEITADGVKIGEEWVEAKNVVWGAGLRAESVVDTLGLEQDRMGRVVVESSLLAKGDGRIFVVGDVAHFNHDKHGELPGLAPVAMQQGRHAAENVKRALKGAPLLPFQYFDKGIMATIGRASAVAEAGPFKMRGVIAWLAWLFVHLMFLVSFRDKVSVLVNWMYAYVAFRRASRLIVGGDARGELRAVLDRAPRTLEDGASRRLAAADEAGIAPEDAPAQASLPADAA